ncbi:NfeD family protein [Veronia pacifica]|uniref:Activity regulator of membrane protease YbbK n=1 Tax=Veronia pacifica TaxID=1080227 RepID=A0A1C3EIM8_9GAMM|nr:NfeD family protein [Veronia pacifica]ODA33101.1 activity regulator of membrane protease YbbK [Veronia pacifica]
MQIFEYLQTNLAESAVIIGMVLLIIEVWLLSFSTVIFMALAISFILSGIMIWGGLLPETFGAVVSFSLISSLTLTLVLWRPLRRFHPSRPINYNIHSDLIGLTFTLDKALDADTYAEVKHSGINWKLRLGQKHCPLALPPGSQVKVTRVDVGCFTVEPIK